MSGSLKRAFGLWVAAQVPGLHVHADGLANVSSAYPACTVTELAHSLTRYGCGRRDFTERDPDSGDVVASGKLVRAETTYRLTLQAPSGPHGNGQEIVDAVLERLGEAVDEANLAWSPLVLEDTETDPPEVFRLDRIAIEGWLALPPDVSGEPFLYRGSFSVRLARTVALTLPVEGIIEHIHLQEHGE